MNMQEKIRFILKFGGETQSELAKRIGVSQSTVNRWLTGSEPEGDNRDRINGIYETLTDVEHATPATHIIPIMGYVGAGGDVDPDFEQIPPEGLDQVTLPFPVPAEMVAFRVKGTSMLPVYRDGTVIVVYREQKRALETFFGEEAAVRTADGRRFIKQIMRGSDGTVTLASWNDVPIEGQRLEWIGEIFAILPPSTLRRVGRQGGLQGQMALRTA
jgi:repressor LexA